MRRADEPRDAEGGSGVRRLRGESRLLPISLSVADPDGGHPHLRKVTNENNTVCFTVDAEANGTSDPLGVNKEGWEVDFKIKHERTMPDLGLNFSPSSLRIYSPFVSSPTTESPKASLVLAPPCGPPSPCKGPPSDNVELRVAPPPLTPSAAESTPPFKPEGSPAFPESTKKGPSEEYRLQMIQKRKQRFQHIQSEEQKTQERERAVPKQDVPKLEGKASEGAASVVADESKVHSKLRSPESSPSISSSDSTLTPLSRCNSSEPTPLRRKTSEQKMASLTGMRFALSPSSILSLYEIYEDEVLGEGAWSKVVKGKEIATDATVAVKIINKRNIKDYKAVENERTILRMARCRYIVNILYADEDRDFLYYVMEYAHGGELSMYVQKFGLEDMHRIAPYFVGELVLALEYLHNHGILHRDVKPENVLLTRDYHVKLGDFGSAIWTESAREAKGAGTVQYMDPEVLAGRPPSAANDLWALGCIVYYLHTGVTPFRGATDFMVFQSIKKCELVFPPYFPPVARDLVERLMRPQPTARIGSGPFGYRELKSHSFFNEVNWNTIHLHCNVTKANKDYSKEVPASYLFPNELVVYAGYIRKEGRWVTSEKQRYLVLTDHPRLFYLDPVSLKVKGHVAMSEEVWAEGDGGAFKVHTPGRAYAMYCDGNDSKEETKMWVNRINAQLKNKYQRGRSFSFSVS